jgi:hypothetical protein
MTRKRPRRNETFDDKDAKMNAGFEINDVVYGVRCGKFMIVGFRTVGGTQVADCKEVGPNGEIGRGEIAMPLDCIQSNPRS